MPFFDPREGGTMPETTRTDLVRPAATCCRARYPPAERAVFERTAMTRYPADQRVLRMSYHAVRSTLAITSGSDLTRACRRHSRLAHPCRVQPRTPPNTGVDINKS